LPPARKPESETERGESGPEAFAQALESHLEGVCQLSPERVAVLFGHYLLFQRWNRVLNLSSVVDFESIVLRHYCESLFLGARLPNEPLSIVDFGSGAGFPGIPLAVLRPDCRVCLVESHRRKAVFLKEATRSLSNVQVRAERAEDVGERFDWLVSRAVAWKDLAAFASRAVSGVALLTSGSESREPLSERTIRWEPAVPLPWGRQMVLLIGRVPRETC
jgi:16S rRNA (guanine527-N7)-methyltransferase